PVVHAIEPRPCCRELLGHRRAQPGIDPRQGYLGHRAFDLERARGNTRGWNSRPIRIGHADRRAWGDRLLPNRLVIAMDQLIELSRATYVHGMLLLPSSAGNPAATPYL